MKTKSIYLLFIILAECTVVKGSALLHSNIDSLNYKNDIECFWSDFKKCLKNKDSNCVASHIQFPFKVECLNNQEKGGEFSEEDFYKKYISIFDDKSINSFLLSNIKDVLKSQGDATQSQSKIWKFDFAVGYEVWSKELEMKNEYGLIFSFERIKSEWKLVSIRCVG